MVSEEENLRKIIEESEKKIMDAKAKLELIEKKKFEEEITRLQEWVHLDWKLTNGLNLSSRKGRNQ